MLRFGRVFRATTLFISLAIAGCASLVAPYDATFDQALNKLSEDTAKFLAAATADGPEQSATSKEAIAYYATTYNVLDRLSMRAAADRAIIPCIVDAELKEQSKLKSSSSPLPDDYMKFDCLEYQLYATRYYVDALQHFQQTDKKLTPSEAKIYGGQLQRAIMGSIQTFLVTKPSK
jgi:hypothetical protein